MGRLFAQILSTMARTRLVGVFDVDPSTAERVANEFSARHFHDLDELLSTREVAAVVVATPEQHHQAPTLAALAADKPVFVEKPLASSSREATEMIRVAEARRLPLVVGHVLRFDAAYARAREAVRSGEIGTILQVTARRQSSLREAERLAGRTSLAWYLGIHDVDAIQWTTGNRISNVFARGTSTALREYGVHDTVFSLIGFEDGSIGAMEHSWIRPDGARMGSGKSLEIIGTTGMVSVDPNLAATTVVSHGRVAEFGQAYPTDGLAHLGAYRREMDHFADCVLDGAVPAPGGPEVLHAIRVVEAMERSLSTNRHVVVRTH
jgi:myo-inositol 2-dehydrogenase/D-chiro-inositol 1-dehydrogenase